MGLSEGSKSALMHLCLVVIVFALVAHRQHSDCFGVFHFQQRDITTILKTYHQFPQERFEQAFLD